MKVEICATSLESVLNAQKAGADRVELCSELAVGGITPSYGFLRKVMEMAQIPVNVLIRPRSGDFTYSNDEFEIMEKDIALCKELGCNGIVSGVLRSDGTIDLERTAQLIKASGPMEFTFHRAFDWTPNPMQAIKDLATLGCDRLLSSGQAKKAIDGIDLLKKVKQQAGTVSVMPGGGVREDNIAAFKSAGFTEIHFSGTVFRTTLNNIPEISMNTPDFLRDTEIAISDLKRIQKMIESVK